MGDANLNIKVSAEVVAAVKNFGSLGNAIDKAKTEVRLLGTALDHAIAGGGSEKTLDKLGEQFDKARDKLKLLQDAAAKGIPLTEAGAGIGAAGTGLKEVVEDSKKASDGLLGMNLSTGRARIAFLDLGRIVTGQGFNLRSLASNFALVGPGVTIAVAALYGLYEVLGKQTDAEKKADEAAKHLKETLFGLKDAGDVTLAATGGEAGNIARVQALAAAIRDSNLPYAERQHALEELRKTNKAYFGDLTLEADSLKTLASRVNDYSQALIAEAVVKGQVEEIANVSRELAKQEKVLSDLGKARDAQSDSLDKVTAATIKNNEVIGQGGSSKVLDAQTALDALTTKYLKQNNAVADLKEKIADYTSELNKAVTEQLKFKPLNDDTGKVQLGNLKEILKQIADINKVLAEADKRPLFKRLADSDDKDQIHLLQVEIADAIKKGAIAGATDPDLGKAYDQLAKTLGLKLSKLQNPALAASVDFTLANPADATKASDKLASEVEKEFGKPIKVTVPIDQKIRIESSGFDDKDQKILLNKLEKDALLNLPPVKWTPVIQALIDGKTLQDETIKELNKAVTGIEKGIAVSGLASIGIALGDALSGQGFAKAIAGFENTLGEGLIEVGKQLILASTIIQGIKSALGTLFTDPVIGIVAGVGAIALGEVLKNSVSKVGAHAFATGGIVTGPTLGLVGEAGPEAIFPLSQLNRFIKNTQGNNATNINITGRLSGNDLRLVMARANKNQALV